MRLCSTILCILSILLLAVGINLITVTTAPSNWAGVFNFVEKAYASINFKYSSDVWYNTASPDSIVSVSRGAVIIPVVYPTIPVVFVWRSSGWSGGH